MKQSQTKAYTVEYKDKVYQKGPNSNVIVATTKAASAKVKFIFEYLL